MIQGLREIRAKHSITDVDWNLIVEELSQLLRQAENGGLNFDADRKRGVVCQTVRCPDILEARLSRTLGVEEGRRLLRLYFTEPEAKDGLLLSLHLRDKSDGKSGLAEQDQHIDEAQEHLDRWWQCEIGL